MTKPAVPRARKAFGTSTNVDNEVLLFSERELDAYGAACYRAGIEAAIGAAAALVGRRGVDYTDAMRAQDDAWADYRAGRGPHPARR